MRKLIAAIAAAWLLCCSAAEAQQRRALTFQLDFLVNGYHAPFFVALERGWYREAGIDVTLRQGRGSADTIRLVGAGQAEMGFADAGTTARAVADGVPVTVVAVVVQDSPNGIVSFAERAIRQPQDLVGRSLAIVPAGATARLLPGFLAINRIDPAQVRIQEYNFGNIVPSFLAGQVDSTIGFLFGEFLTARAGARGREVVFMRFADHGMNPYSVSIMARNELIQQSPDTVRGFVQASLRGLRFAIDNPAEAIALLARHTETDPAMLRAQLDAAIPLINTAEAQRNGLGSMTAERWEETQRLMIQYLEQRERVAPERLYTDRFLR